MMRDYFCHLIQSISVSLVRLQETHAQSSRFKEHLTCRGKTRNVLLSLLWVQLEVLQFRIFYIFESWFYLSTNNFFIQLFNFEILIYGFSCWFMLVYVLSIKIFFVLTTIDLIMLHPFDRLGGCNFYFSPFIKHLKDFIDSVGFLNLDFMGPKFTWYNNKIGGVQIWVHLNHVFANATSLRSPRKGLS